MISSINSSQLASQFFSRLDSKNQGYIEQSDFSSAISQVSQNTDSDEISALFKTFDSDSDGKVTESEFTSRLGQLLSQLEEQAGQSRMHGGMPPPGGPQGMGGMPPPPPQDDAGFTKEELSAQLDEIGSTDSKRSNLIAKVVENFDQADTDGDGKVSFQEAMALEQSSQTSDSGSSTQTHRHAAHDDSDARLMLQLTRLLAAYADTGDGTASTQLSAVA